MRFVAVFVAMLGVALVPVHAQKRRAVRVPGAAWTSGLAASTIPVTTIAGKAIQASSRLRVTWQVPSVPVDHFVVTAVDVAGGLPLAFPAASSPVEITTLASGTEYRITIAACIDTACVTRLTDDAAVTAKTDDEYWQIRGTGSSYATAQKLISDGNTKPWVLVWGTEAGSLSGRAQLYYDPSVPSEKGIKIGTSSTPVTSSADSISSFTPLSGFGFHRNDSAGNSGTGPATFQVVAMREGFIRLFYEAETADHKGRVYSVDGQDGWSGRDFNRGSATVCQDSDLASGGACEPTLVIGTESEGNPKIRQARQFKLLLPTRDTWLWDSAPGTSMVFTAHLTDSTCSSTFFNAGFAIWSGSRWVVQYAADGCPKLIPGVQAPMPVHLGGTRYKMYFNNNTGGTVDHKPLKILYADGGTFDGFEPVARARELHVLWPSGAELTETEESMFDDFQVTMPTNDPMFQVIYSNMTCPANACGPPFIGMAVLLNP